MKNELFQIGPFTVYGYGLMIAVGVMAAWITAEYRAKKMKMQYEHIFYLVIWCLVEGCSAPSSFSGSRNGKSLCETLDSCWTLSATDLWYTEELSAAFWQDGCTAG